MQYVNPVNEAINTYGALESISARREARQQRKEALQMQREDREYNRSRLEQQSQLEQQKYKDQQAHQDRTYALQEKNAESLGSYRDTLANTSQEQNARAQQVHAQQQQEYQRAERERKALQLMTKLHHSEKTGTEFEFSEEEAALLEKHPLLSPAKLRSNDIGQAIDIVEDVSQGKLSLDQLNDNPDMMKKLSVLYPELQKGSPGEKHFAKFFPGSKEDTIMIDLSVDGKPGAPLTERRSADDDDPVLEVSIPDMVARAKAAAEGRKLVMDEGGKQYLESLYQQMNVSSGSSDLPNDQKMHQYWMRVLGVDAEEALGIMKMSVRDPIKASMDLAEMKMEQQKLQYLEPGDDGYQTFEQMLASSQEEVKQMQRDMRGGQKEEQPDPAMEEVEKALSTVGKNAPDSHKEALRKHPDTLPLFLEKYGSQEATTEEAPAPSQEAPPPAPGDTSGRGPIEYNMRDFGVKLRTADSAGDNLQKLLSQKDPSQPKKYGGGGILDAVDRGVVAPAREAGGAVADVARSGADAVTGTLGKAAALSAYNRALRDNKMYKEPERHMSVEVLQDMLPYIDDEQERERIAAIIQERTKQVASQ